MRPSRGIDEAQATSADDRFKNTLKYHFIFGQKVSIATKYACRQWDSSVDGAFPILPDARRGPHLIRNRTTHLYVSGLILGSAPRPFLDAFGAHYGTMIEECRHAARFVIYPIYSRGVVTARLFHKFYNF